jgi:hypothetical protein
LFIIELAWEHYLKANVEVALLYIITHMVLVVKDGYTFTTDFFDSFWGDYLINSKQNASSIKEWDFHWLDLDGLLQSNLVLIN